MSRLRKEIDVIPAGAWAVAIALPLVVLTCAVVFFSVVLRRSGDHSIFPWLWPILVGTLILASLFVYTLLVGYIAGDARRRGMRPILWTLLAIFIPNAIGIILYFILREPLLHRCPRCGSGVKATFPYCPSCGAGLAGKCPSCQNAVEPEWSHCARCGTALSSAQPTAGDRGQV